MKGGRGYLYVALGLAFGIYRGAKVVQWGAWDFLDQAIALGMMAVGAYIIFKKRTA